MKYIIMAYYDGHTLSFITSAVKQTDQVNHRSTAKSITAQCVRCWFVLFVDMKK